jgi:hypothetical protein
MVVMTVSSTWVPTLGLGVGAAAVSTGLLQAARVMAMMLANVTAKSRDPDGVFI